LCRDVNPNKNVIFFTTYLDFGPRCGDILKKDKIRTDFILDSDLLSSLTAVASCTEAGVATMTTEKQQFPSPTFDKKILVIVGGYGSGKSEVSVNLARHLADAQSEPVTIADVDIINPYFRSREATRELEGLGIRCLVPPGDQTQADLPIIIPEIKGAIKDNDGYLILDVGGDDLGARVLASLSDAFQANTYELLLVLNANRPFTSTAEGTIKVIEEISQSAHLSFTGIVSNTHLMEHTTPDEVTAGVELANEVSGRTGIPVKFVSATEDVVAQLNGNVTTLPVLALDRTLLKPWERRKSTG
jgi:MinD-like ATPase involved in chromosome partitioning or flagellar assembly